MSGDSRPPVAKEGSVTESDPLELPQDDAGNGVIERDWPQVTLEEAVKPIAIAAMLTCIAIAVAQVVSLFAPEWPGRFFTGFTFLVSLESIHAQRAMSRLGFGHRDRWRFRFVEWVVILVVMRLWTSLGRGTQGLLADIASWSADLRSFFDLSFIAASALIATFWGLALMLSRAMQELEVTSIEKKPSVTAPDYYLRSTMPHRGRTDRQARLSMIVSIFFWGGAAILLLSGIARVDVRDLLSLRHPHSSGIILNVMVYFLIGLLLISHAQYTILRANSELANVPILGRLGKRWMLLAMAFLLLVALVSALLPVGYSVGLLESVSAAVEWVGTAILKVVSVLLFIVSMILSLLMGRPSGAPAESAREPMPSPPALPPAVANEPWPWWGVVRSLIFWTILTGVVGYSLFHFARDRWGLFQGITLTRFLTWLRSLWQGLRSGTRRTAARIRHGIGRRLGFRKPRERRRAWRYLSLRRLSPRDRVRYYYLSILHRSSRQGFGRPPWMTPLEYQDTLASEVPSASDQVAQLSDAFVEARYSQHPVSSEDAKGLREVWHSVRKAITSRRRASGKGPTVSTVGRDQRS